MLVHPYFYSTNCNCQSLLFIFPLHMSENNKDMICFINGFTGVETKRELLVILKCIQ